MHLWLLWWDIITTLRPAFSYVQTYRWFLSCVAGMMIRSDNTGVTSLIRALGLKGNYYDRMLDSFHSKAVDRDLLVQLWTQTVIRLGLGHPLQGRWLLIGDGIKVPKEGKKMPAVKSLHQESGSNSKPQFIMGHSCQALALCCETNQCFFALPLTVRIHEGIVLSNRDRRTLLDKMAALITRLALSQPFYFLADAYYASGKMVKALLEQGNHLITRVRSNAVAYFPTPLPQERKPGRPKKYGKKVNLKSLFTTRDAFRPRRISDGTLIQYRSGDLLWRPAGQLVRFVLMIHPVHGRTIYMTTDVSLAPERVIDVYALRFKIEITFRQAIHTVGTFAYHFWMKDMTPIPRGSKNQHLHKETPEYREAIARKMDAYHLHLQTGVIAQGILQYIAAVAPALVWKHFRSWIRTVRPGVRPSEAITAKALRNTFADFLLGFCQDEIFTKFIIEKLDEGQNNPLRLSVA